MGWTESMHALPGRRAIKEKLNVVNFDDFAEGVAAAAEDRLFCVPVLLQMALRGRVVGMESF